MQRKTEKLKGEGQIRRDKETKVGRKKISLRVKISGSEKMVWSNGNNGVRGSWENDVLKDMPIANI